MNISMSNSKFVVKSKPEIACSNGIRIVFGNEGESVDISQVYPIINQAIELLELIRIEKK
jgi:hypothetical protein